MSPNGCLTKPVGIIKCPVPLILASWEFFGCFFIIILFIVYLIFPQCTCFRLFIRAVSDQNFYISFKLSSTRNLKIYLFPLPSASSKMRSKVSSISRTKFTQSPRPLSRCVGIYQPSLYSASRNVLPAVWNPRDHSLFCYPFTLPRYVDHSLTHSAPLAFDKHYEC